MKECVFVHGANGTHGIDVFTISDVLGVCAVSTSLMVCTKTSHIPCSACTMYLSQYGIPCTVYLLLSLLHTQALVKEDELMSRLEMLENQLEVYSKVCTVHVHVCTCMLCIPPSSIPLYVCTMYMPSHAYSSFNTHSCVSMCS